MFRKLSRTIFENDIFVGTRIALNDVQDTAVLAGALFDLDDRSTVLTVEAERRLDDNWSAEIEARFFVNVQNDRIVRNFERDSFLNISLIRHF